MTLINGQRTTAYNSAPWYKLENPNVAAHIF